MSENVHGILPAKNLLVALIRVYAVIAYLLDGMAQLSPTLYLLITGQLSQSFDYSSEAEYIVYALSTTGLFFLIWFAAPLLARFVLPGSDRLAHIDLKLNSWSVTAAIVAVGCYLFLGALADLPSWLILYDQHSQRATVGTHIDAEVASILIKMVGGLLLVFLSNGVTHLVVKLRTLY